MLVPNSLVSDNNLRQEIYRHYHADEAQVVQSILPKAVLNKDVKKRVQQRAYSLASEVRTVAQNGSQIQKLLNQYALSTNEGIVLMCLAEALLRVPDKITADRLIRDKLLRGDWSAHIGVNNSLFVNSSTWGLLLSGQIVRFNDEEKRNSISGLKKIIGKVGEPIIRKSMQYAMKIMGNQFVLGRTIKEAMAKSEEGAELGVGYSYDMLGEAARTMKDADAYYLSYKNAIEFMGRQTSSFKQPKNSISIKLSALHPRFELAKYQVVMTELVPRVKSLMQLALKFDIDLTIDAEETDRLDISLDIFEELFSDSEFKNWQGLGIVIQAYQKRALPVIEWLINLSRKVGKRINIRLVKGAYWDHEIKHAHVEGTKDFPVFTRKSSTDVSYQACARVLLENRGVVFPQFATHNAYTAAYILECAGSDKSGFEFQRLHGMGSGLYEGIQAEFNIPTRIYAPVGKHKALLAYLVRRLLENGANSSFVNNIVDTNISIESLIQDPVAATLSYTELRNIRICTPPNLYGEERSNSSGIELTDIPRLNQISKALESYTSDLAPLQYENIIYSVNPANTDEVLGFEHPLSGPELENKLVLAQQAHIELSQLSFSQRAARLEKLASLIEVNYDELIVLCIKEAGKVLADAVAEVREAVDFCRYYAVQARGIESSQSSNEFCSLGVMVCISPWNFPLAIFLGQVTAALAAGNSVLAKPADTTILIAKRAVDLLSLCDFPENAVQLIITPGPIVGKKLVPKEQVSGVMFTGSTNVGSLIARTLAARSGKRVPLIAETGGQNCMIVDSTALPEQVVDDVISSGFKSAGQRCSALRVLYIQRDIADDMIKMIIGAMKELHIGNPAHLSTDIGPVIDERALNALNSHVEKLNKTATLLYKCELSSDCGMGTYFSPHLYEINDINELSTEVFGPVVHIIRYDAKRFDETIDQINSAGFGLTAGIHSRIEGQCDRFTRNVDVGNVYVNRNTVGAVVGVQPFGGRGLSGTGPKAGGPSYLYKLLKQTAVTDAPFQLSSETKFTPTKSEKINWLAAEVFLTNRNSRWKNTPVNQRIDVVTKLISEIENTNGLTFSHFFSSDIKQICSEARGKQGSERILVGPTGEKNSLFYEPKGNIFCFQGGVNYLEASLKQLIAALALGNRVVFFNQTNLSLKEALNKLELNTIVHVIHGALEETLKHFNNEPLLDGVAACGTTEFLREVDTTISNTCLKILPLITQSNGIEFTSCFTVEKTVSVDTTAAGGNASLMAMSG